MVFALAGDSTMTRLSAMVRGTLQPKNEKPRTSRGPQSTSAPRSSVRCIERGFRDQPAEPLDRLFLTRLTRQHHQYHPLELFAVGLVRIERQHALDHDLALQRIQHTRALQLQQQSAALGRE